MTPIGAIIEAIDLFFDYMYGGNLAVGEVGKPPGTWFSATGWYYSGYNEKHYMSISITGNNNGEVAYAGDHIHIFTNPSVANLGSFDVNNWSGWIQLNSGDNFDFTAVLPDGTNENINILTFGAALDSQQNNWWINDNTTSLPTAGGGSFIGMHGDDSSFPIISNDDSLSNTGLATIIYVPIDKNTSYTYDDAMDIVLPALQVRFPDLDASDFKSESEIIFGEDTTEETGSLNIDYDKILSEGELESILTQETYEIPEYETAFFTETETILIDNEEEIATELEGVPDFIVDSVKSGWGVLQDWGVAGFFVSCATVCMIWKIIHGK